jgi:drug/metabolite transporter (DMT)-like permease
MEKSVLRPPPLHVYLVLLAGTISVSFAPILVRYAQAEGVPSVLVAASRLVFAAILVTPLVLTRHMSTLRTLTRKEVALAAISGVFLAAHFLTWVISLEYTSVLISTVIVTSSPIWVAILESFLLRAKLPKAVILGLVIAIIGGIMISLTGAIDPGQELDSGASMFGAFLALLGALCMPFYLMIARKLGDRIPIMPYIWMVYGSAGIVLMVAAIASSTPLTGYSDRAWLAVAGMVIFPQLIGHTSLNYAVKFMPLTLVSMVSQMEPIGSSILAFLIFAELPLPIQIAGSAIIVTGVILANLGHLRKGN